MRAHRARVASLVAVVATSLAACAGSPRPPVEPHATDVAGATGHVAQDGSPTHPRRSRVVTLAFAGDMHFELQLAALLERTPKALSGPSPARSHVRT